MTDYVLSSAADADIEGILRISLDLWGSERAEQYIVALHKAFEMLSEFPRIGRNIGHIRTGYFRFEHESHSVFYRLSPTGIFIVRVLHQKQQPERHL